MSKKRFAVMFDQLSDFQAAGLFTLMNVMVETEAGADVDASRKCLRSIVNGSESANSSCLP